MAGMFPFVTKDRLYKLYIDETENDKRLFCVWKQNQRTGSSQVVTDLKPTEDRDLLLSELLMYARDLDYRPEIAWKIEEGSRVLQKGPSIYRDTAKLSDEEKIAFGEEFFEKKREIEKLEKELEIELKRLKAECKEKVSDIENEMFVAEQCFVSGISTLDVEASWERDPENGLMHLIRHDTLDVIRTRKMDIGESQGNMFTDEGNSFKNDESFEGFYDNSDSSSDSEDGLDEGSEE